MVRSRGRCVPRSAPLTSRKPRSPQDLNRQRPLARPTPTGPPRRSMSASTTRPVRHSTPLSLSIVGRPHEAGLIRSWRADSLVFVWLDPGITPCCKSRLNRAVMAFVSAFPRRTPQADIVRRVENDSFHTAKALKQVRLPELADVVIDIGSLGPIAHSPEIRS